MILLDKRTGGTYMEPFDENSFPTDEPEQAPQNTQPENDISASSPDTGYHGAGVGQRETTYQKVPYGSQNPAGNPNYSNFRQDRTSPYADSPYVAGAPREDPRYYNYNYQPSAAPKPPKKHEKKSGRGVWKTVVAAVLVVAMVAGGCLITANVVDSRWEKRNQETISQFNSKISSLENQISSQGSTNRGTSGAPVASTDLMTPNQVYAQNVDAVVTVSSTIVSRSYGQTTHGTSRGSGFLISADGYVVTNYHVVEGATSITVTTHKGTEYPATMNGYDSTNDVAVLKIEGQDLPYVVVGSSDSLEIGDMVVAIGNPLGTLSATQTVGYVSGKNREVSTDNSVINMIQTDAVINPGNSGGPLFNMYGEVVGITTAKYSGTTSSGASIEGIGFAIPIDDVMSIIGDLRDLGYVTGAYLGVTVQDTDKTAANLYGMPTGALIVTVVEGGSADRAGVKVNDIVIALGEYEVTSTNTLTRALRKFDANDVTTITVIRSGKQQVLEITLDERPAGLNGSSGSTEPSMPEEGNFDEWYEFFRRYGG